jgi:hypothetical protein
VGGIPVTIIVAVLLAVGAVLVVYRVTRPDGAALPAPSAVGQRPPIAALGGTTAFIQAADLPAGFRPFGPEGQQVFTHSPTGQSQLLLGFGTGPCGGAQGVAAVPTSGTLISSGMWLGDAAGQPPGYQASAGSITFIYSTETVAETAYGALASLLRCEARSGSAIQVGVVSQVTGLGDEAVMLRTRAFPPAGAYETILARLDDKDFLFVFEDGNGMTAVSEQRLARAVMSRP